MSEAYKKLIKTLQSIFEMDKADLDFGIYRIMNQKRDEINHFLENNLLLQVKEAFANIDNDSKPELQKQLVTEIEQARKYGAPDPENSPAVLEIKKKLENAVDTTALENEVFSKLQTFFSRYYDKGDFISQRRYKADTYAIPYEGEEIKLHWANHDQYYIKSSEHLKDYAFIVKGPNEQEKPFRIRLIEADTEKDNVKAKSDDERRFVIDKESPIFIKNGELNINFHFIPVGKKTQDKLNEEAAQTIFKIAAPEFTDWLALLKRPAPTEKNKERTLLEKHLNEYTSRNTFDYFVHKDLGGFLNRELNFFIKNEVFHLDDLAESSFKLTETQLAKAKVIKLIVSKIIRMLAQIEDFQKKIWLKKKFIIEKNYCIPLSRLPDNIIDLCLKNNLQIDEWKNLGFTSENNDISLELNKIGNLLVDTKNFSRNDKLKILSNVNNLDEILQGEVIHGENFSALNLLSEKYRASVQTICIDPPYNIGGDDFLYKDKFKHSSWISMMRDRIALGRALLKNSGVFYSNIDDKERLSLELTLDNVFGNNNKIEELIWMQNTTNNQAPMYSTNHEYIQCYAIDKSSVANVEWMFRDKKPGAEEVLTLISKLNPSFPSIDEIENKINDLYSSHRREIETELNSAGLEYDKKLDPWKSIYLYSNAEYRTDDGRYVNESDAQKYNAKIWLWGSDNPSRPASKQAAETKNPNHPSFCFYKPKHPTTGELCPHPNRGWAWPARPVEGLKGSFEEMNNDHRIAWGKDHTTIPRKKIFIHEAASQVSQSIIADYTDGEKELAHLFGRNQVFPNPKPSSLIEKLINQSSGENSIICDFFAGSGTTGQAVLTSEVYRKYILVEQGEHFYDVLMPRLKKLYFSEVWKDGKPDVNIDKKKTQSTRKGFSYAVIESYEDSLSNLNISKNNYSDLLEENKSLKEDYYLNYFLSYDTKNSQSLFNIESFNEFDSYKMNFSPASSSVKKPTDIDIIETFNYLIGIKLDSIQNYGSTIVLNGHLRNNESCIVIWRKIDELPNEKLGQFLHKLSISPLDTEFSYIYINGDHTLEDPFSKVRMIEAEFKRLMFDVQDV